MASQRGKSGFSITLLLLAVLFAISLLVAGNGVYAQSDPIVDGVLDNNYTWLEHFTIGDPDGHTTLAPGDLYGYEGASNCYWTFVVDRAFNDNVYADSGLDDAYMLLDGWTVEHSYGKLDGSDKMLFSVAYPGGTHADLEIGYIDENGGVYDVDGWDAPINDAASSLGWNMANSGWDGGAWGDIEAHSPPYDYNIVGVNYWEWHMIYEFSIPKSAMGGVCGTMTQGGAHNSPNKDQESAGIIGDYVWNDVNGNGIQDDGGGAAGLGDVTVNLKNAGGVVIRTTQTSAAGAYFFNNLSAGAYTVEVDDSTLPAGSWFLTGAPDSGPNPRSVTLATDEEKYDIDFGYTQSRPELDIDKSLTSSNPATVGDEVVFTIRVTNIGDSTITVLPLEDIYDPTKLLYLSATPASDSASNGVITWNDLTTGPGGDLAPNEHIDVVVRFQALATALNRQITAAPAGMSPPLEMDARSFEIAAIDSVDAIGATDYCECDGGITQLTLIYRDPGGHPLVDIVVDSTKATPTNFTDVADGDAITIYNAPSETKLEARTKFILSDAGTGNAFLLAEVHTSCSVEIGPGQLWNGALEVAIVVPLSGWKTCSYSSIGDRVFDDLDGSGLPDGGVEPGLNSVDVELYGGFCPAPAGALITSMTTAGNGDYSFTDLPAGDYCVSVDQATTPTDYGLTTGNDPLDVSLSQGTAFDTADFGFQLIGTASIGDRVFYDVDGSGLPDVGIDPGLNGVTVNLYQGVSCSGDAFRSMTTSGNGDYDFTQLPADNYCVEVDGSTLPAGLTLTTGNQPLFGSLADGEDFNVADFGYRAEQANGTCDFAAVDNAIDEYGKTPPPVNDSACVEITDPPLGSIGNQVWLEEDGDGVFDPVDGDVGIENVTVDLYMGGVYQGTQTTNGSGEYTFPALAAGTYTVTVSDNNGALSAYEVTSDGPNQGQNNNNQIQPYTVNLAAGEDNETADFGYTDGGGGSGDEGDIGDLVWFDRNSDGVYQPDGEDGIPGNDDDEPGLGNVTVRLCVANTPLCVSTTTDADGAYLFKDKGLNTNFLVTVTDQNGVLNALGLVHSALGTSHTNNENQVQPDYPVLLTVANPFDLTADFGYTEGGGGSSNDGDVGDLVWYDKNGDGVYQPNGADNLPGTADDEVGIDGVTVELCIVNTPLCDQQTTSNGGGYLFIGKGLNTDYLVTVTDDNGVLSAMGLVHSQLGTPGVSGQNQVQPDYPVSLTDAHRFDDSADFGYTDAANYSITKTLTGDNPVRTGDLVTFVIRVLNTGNLTLTSVPLEDSYNKDYLTFVGATPEADSNADTGLLTWSDLTQAGAHGAGYDPAPGQWIDVTVEFIAQLDTTLLPNSETINTGTGRNVSAEGVTIPDKSDSAGISIFNPTGVVVVNRTLSHNDGVITVAWDTTDETQLAAFNIYRSSEVSGRVLVTAEPIAAERSGQASGGAYSYADAALDSSSSYHYELELLTVDGIASPVDMGVIDLTSGRVLLPLVSR